MADLKVSVAPVAFTFGTSQVKVTLTKARPSWWDRRRPKLDKGVVLLRLINYLLELGQRVWELVQPYLRVRAQPARGRT